MSMLFSESYYLNNNPDVLAAVIAGSFPNGLAHYNAHGWAEGRDPNANFDTSYYLQQNPDVLQAVLDGHFSSPLAHFLAHGAAEGRAPNAATAELLTYFDADAYLAANPDVAAAVAAGDFTAEGHWLLHGQFEGRDGGPVLPPVGETFQLTTGTDSGAAFQGGDGDDVYNAPVQPTALLPLQTLNTDDNIDGGGGRNTLNAQLVDPYVIPAGLNNIQVLNISSPGGLGPLLFANPILDVLNSNAIDEINFRNPLQNVTINNLQTALDTVGIYDDVVVGTVSTINHVGTATDGTDDALEINLRNAAAGSVLVLNYAGGGANSGYEIININSMGPLGNVFTLVNDTSRDVSVTGNADLILDGLSFNSVRLFDASTLMADLEVYFVGGNAGAAEVDIVGAQGDNYILLDGTAAAATTIQTFDGSDWVEVFDHVGDVNVDVGEGDDQEVDFFNVAGNVSATAGAGDDFFYFGDITGDVSVDAGDGDNWIEFYGFITGAINVLAGDGDDTVTFFQEYNTPLFVAGDTVDLGGGQNLIIFDIDNYPGGGAVDVLQDGITILNVQTLRVEGDIGADEAGLQPLNVNMANSGSANRLELAASFMGDVNVSNLNFGAGDVVAIYNSLSFDGGDLTLTRAPLTAPGYNLELYGVNVGSANVGLGSDVLFLSSLGDPDTDLNQIFDVSGVNADVVITGDVDLNFGSAGVGNVYNNVLFGGTIDASGATGNNQVWTGLGSQTIIDGDGDDTYGIYFNGLLGTDTIQLAGGSDTVLFFNLNTSANGDLGGLHLVTGFEVGAAGDQLAISLSAGNFFETDGTAVAAGDNAVIRNVENGDLLNLSGGDFNFLKFTTAVDGSLYANLEDMFSAAIGLGQVTVNGAVDNIMAALYDSDAGMAMFFALDNVGGLIDTNDDVDGLTAVEMSYADFLAFSSDDFFFA